MTGEQCSGLRAAFALTGVPAQLLPLLSLGGGARSVGARVGAEALALSAMGLGTRSGWGGVSRQLTVSRGGSSEGGGDASEDQQRLTVGIKECTDERGLLGLVDQSSMDRASTRFMSVLRGAKWLRCQVRGGGVTKGWSSSCFKS
jgi:hypothetical protein